METTGFGFGGKGGGGSGPPPMSSLPYDNTLFVDFEFGDDGTALPQRFDLPYKTGKAAETAAVAGQTIVFRPFSYNPTQIGGIDATTRLEGKNGVSYVFEDGCEITDAAVPAPSGWILFAANVATTSFAIYGSLVVELSTPVFSVVVFCNQAGSNVYIEMKKCTAWSNCFTFQNTQHNVNIAESCEVEDGNLSFLQGNIGNSRFECPKINTKSGSTLLGNCFQPQFVTGNLDVICEGGRMGTFGGFLYTFAGANENPFLNFNLTMNGNYYYENSASSLFGALPIIFFLRGIQFKMKLTGVVACTNENEFSSPNNRAGVFLICGTGSPNLRVSGGTYVTHAAKSPVLIDVGDNDLSTPESTYFTNEIWEGKSSPIFSDCKFEAYDTDNVTAVVSQGQSGLAPVSSTRKTGNQLVLVDCKIRGTKATSLGIRKEGATPSSTYMLLQNVEIHSDGFSLTAAGGDQDFHIEQAIATKNPDTANTITNRLANGTLTVDANLVW